uniref:Sal-like protein 3 n=1 Tax=Petromyzon marinus TaxID=7757 RepID=A0AAJ7T3R7_PETMA|nr:sal-like protein 3 [Petromyzon marinus]
MACAVAVPPPEPIGDFPAWLEAQGVNAEVARAMDSELGIRDYGVLRACVGDGLVRAELLAAARDRLPFGFYAVLRQVVKALRGAERRDDAGTPRWDEDDAAATSPCGDVTLAGLVEVLLALFGGLSRELLLSARRLGDADGRKYTAASPSSVGAPGTENFTAAVEADGVAEDGNERPCDEKTSDMASSPSYFFPSRIKVESPPPHPPHGGGGDDDRIAAGPSEPACRAVASRAHAAAQRSRVTAWGPRNGGAGEQQQQEEAEEEAEEEEEAAGSSTTSAFPLPLGFGPSGLGPLKLGPLGMGSADLGPSGMGPSGLRHSGLGTLGMGPSRLGPLGLRTSGLGYSELGPSGMAPSRLGPLGIGPSGLRPSGLGYSELGYSELGPSGLRPSQSRPSGLEPSGLEPPALGYSELGPSGLGPSAPAPTAPGPSRWAPSNRGKRPPLSCAVCERTFLLKTNLTVHLRTHTGERPFHCTACDQRFAHVSNLKRHRRKHHDA